MINTIRTIKTDRMDITIDFDNQVIFVQQKWKYTWTTDPSLSSWTYAEKKKFHDTADNLLWQQWSDKFNLKLTGSSKMVSKFNTKLFTVNFDIKWVTANAHWDVKVKKIKSGHFETSSVHWTSKTIKLDTEDLKAVKRTRGTKTYKQHPISHEFGHAIGNTSHISGMHADEYKTSSAFKIDLLSRMNVGNQLRKRHGDYLVSELNKVIPNAKFVVNGIN
ncbi:hypothetical protein [uncultured Algibacter sp.]|uniref:hypothetical protein n=1 Tax=uncultured Algibacter sp. TaxID=298659 RepID=UPI003217CCE1